MISTDFKIIATAIIIGLLVQWLAGSILSRWLKTINFKSMHFDLQPAIAPIRLLIPALVLSMTLPVLTLTDKHASILEHFIQLWIMGCMGFLLTRVVHIAREAMLNRYEVKSTDFHVRRVYTQVRIIEHILDLLIWVLTLALMIMTFSEVKEIGMSIFTSAGIMSIVIGFAAQKTLGNVIAGIQIAISQPIRLEDQVIVEGEFGSIEEITLTYVSVRLWDWRRMILPISYFIEKPFQNWTRTSTEMIGSVFLYVDYDVPLNELRQELTRVLNQSKLWAKKVNVIQVSDVKESTIELRALMDAANAPALWDLRCEVREKLLIFLKDNYPQALSRTRIDLTTDKALENNKQQRGDVYAKVS